MLEYGVEFRLNPKEALELTLKDHANSQRVRQLGKEFGNLLQKLVEIDSNLKSPHANIADLEKQIEGLTLSLSEMLGHADITSKSVAEIRSRLGLG